MMSDALNLALCCHILGFLRPYRHELLGKYFGFALISSFGRLFNLDLLFL